MNDGTIDLSQLEPGKEAALISYLMLEFFQSDINGHAVIPKISKVFLEQDVLAHLNLIQTTLSLHYYMSIQRDQRPNLDVLVDNFFAKLLTSHEASDKKVKTFDP